VTVSIPWTKARLTVSIPWTNASQGEAVTVSIPWTNASPQGEAVTVSIPWTNASPKGEAVTVSKEIPQNENRAFHDGHVFVMADRPHKTVIDCPTKTQSAAHAEEGRSRKSRERWLVERGVRGQKSRGSAKTASETSC
jgi:hypothetical protein